MEQKPDAPLFGGVPDNEPPAPENWSRSLTHRSRVLLHTAPLHDLRAGDAHLDETRRHYDSLALALKTIDLIIENTGLEYEVDRAAVVRALTPLLRAMDEAASVAPDPDRHALMVDRILGALRNDDERRRPFSFAYRDFDARGNAVSRRLEFRLLSDHFHPSGGTVLRLSNEAINLFLNALELDIEDAQTAAEAVVQSQLARGKFDEAVQTARNARLQSLRLQEKIETLLRETRRDVRRVDWRNEAPHLIDEALAHIKTRLDTERGILSVAEERLESLHGTESARNVSQIISLMKECRLRHLKLHERLMGARNVFLEEQERQSFAPAPVDSMPALEAEILEPLLRLDQHQAGAFAAEGFPLFFGARPPAALSLAALIGWQLRPRRDQAVEELSISVPDLAAFEAEAVRFPAEVRERAAAIFASIVAPVRLSELLDGAAADEAGVRELISLTVLHDFAPEQPGGLRIERLPGAELRTQGFYGDEMMILSGIEENA